MKRVAANLSKAVLYLLYILAGSDIKQRPVDKN
jgi:hypothetical protein